MKKEAIYCETEAQAKAVLSILEKQGYKWWRSSDSLTGYPFWDRFEEQTCYSIEEDNKVYYSRKAYYEEEGYQIIPAEDFLNQKEGYFKLKELELIENEFYYVQSKSTPEYSFIFQYKKGAYKTSRSYVYSFFNDWIYTNTVAASDEDILNLREAIQEEIMFFFDKMIEQKNLVWKEIDRCWVSFDIKAQGSGVKIDSTNYVAKQDKGKPRYDLIPPEPLLELAKIMMNGAEKYSENSWKGVEPKRYYSALMRHLEADRMGEITDKETGFLHLSHALANIMFLNWFRIKEQIEREINELK